MCTPPLQKLDGFSAAGSLSWNACVHGLKLYDSFGHLLHFSKQYLLLQHGFVVVAGSLKLPAAHCRRCEMRNC